ncbi:hypothetical protein COB57_01775 [Candidatus Peregrinibacteria bacterium]|nr:MAG: hypothetical protein COB57_01775 [Candidatus Peregrinibacteria bacterium]
MFMDIFVVVVVLGILIPYFYFYFKQNTPLKNNKIETIGGYKKPELLKELENIEKKYERGILPGFWIDYDYRDSSTPIDSVAFAITGGDAIHFCFLTDFGNVKDLNDAPIIVVSPGDTPSSKLIANNLEDFLSIAFTVGDAECLIHDYKSHNDLKIDSDQLYAVDTHNSSGNARAPERVEADRKRLNYLKNIRSIIEEQLTKKFKIEQIKDIPQYINIIREERASLINIKTSDNIGIISDFPEQEIKSFNYKTTETEQIKKFLKNSTLPERLKFYRDSTDHYILAECYDMNIKNLLIEELIKDGFTEESNNLLNS